MARRRCQRGRVFLRGKQGQRNWIGRFRVDVIQQDGRVKRVERSVVLGTEIDIPTEKMALRKLETFLSPINLPDYRPGRITTIEDFAERWKADILVLWKPSARRTALSHLKNHIIPRLGKIRMDELGNELQQVFITQLAEEVSRKMVVNVLSTLSSMLHTAQKRKYNCAKLELKDLVLPQEEVKPETRFFTPEQARDIIEAAKEPFRTMFAVVAMTGTRAGELLGLKVDDLDFAARLIFIRRSVNRGQVQTVKSKASKKPVPIPGALASMLKNYLESWRENSGRWLFANRHGRPFSADKVVMFKLWPILDALKIPRCGLHAFRHTHSSLLLEVGAPPQVAQAQLRHSDPRTTLGIYSHVIGDSQRTAVEKVAQILRPNAPNLEASGEWIH